MEDVHRRPGAYGLDGSYRLFTTYLAGFHAGSGHTFLDGFREWLIVRVGGGNNLVWEALVFMLAFPGETRRSLHARMDDERNAVVVRTLFDALERFLDDRDGRLGGKDMIRADYETWLSRQSWSRPSHRPSDHGQ
ncbi:hypothetical protein [Nonomuraea roseoviolacea]|uniref:Uncharacterized protein n=1 Tax=Nonomuraea roseoviolacea subsp. carminata TaxID=160689 RepID=A0ABT1JYH8_9ACTN|nr:hypothetical protein [Nonomuraea roseoviolacea]MCP2346775.1 hypothetical protein [Nonomuraea roseoviolacea subsp. carminata]